MIPYTKKIRPILVIYLWLTSIILYGQVQKKTPLKERVIANGHQFQINIDKGFQDIDQILKEAIDTRDSTSELKLLERKCLYFYNKEDVNGLIIACKTLQKKAIEYDNPNSIAMSHVYLAETLSINGMHDRAIDELDKALIAIEKVKNKNLKYIYTKANILISQGNTYNDKGEPKKAIEKLLIAIKNYNELKDPEEIQKIQYLNFANLASIYARVNLDSAQYYAKKSINLKPKDYPDDDRMMGLNYLVFGKVSYNIKDNEKALTYFLKAEKINIKRGEALNLAELYNCIIQTYDALNETNKAQEYQQKLKEHELVTLKSKYNSLQKVMEVNAPETKTIGIKNWGVTGLGLFLVTGFTWFLIRRSNAKKALKDENYFFEDKYEQVLNLIKDNDPTFLFHFEELYPDFKTKMLSIEPNLTLSEMEFCILLKLNCSTKKIAQLKFIEVRSVQNKKYRIRKKLSIPQDANLYNWFSEI